MKSRPFALLVWGLAAVSALAGMTALAAGWRVNTTPSVPIGLWQVQALKQSLQRGQIVCVCPPDNLVFQLARQRGYVPPGRCPGNYEPLLKPVAAVPGDWVDVGPTGLRVNNGLMTASMAQSKDGAGRPLPRLAYGSHQVREGTVWLISSGHADGFDSRYFGPVSLRYVEGVAQPIWIGGRS